MKRTLLALAALLSFSGSAFAAACTDPIAVLNGAGTSMNFNTTVDGSNNCTSNTFPGAVLTTLAAWNTSTTLNTVQVIMAPNAGAPSVLVQLNQIANITAGAVTFEGTYDGTNWETIPVSQVINPKNFMPLTNPYTLVPSTNQPFLILSQGYQSLRIKLSTAITASSGAGTITPYVVLLPYEPVLGSLLNPTEISVGGVAVSSVTPFPVYQPTAAVLPTGCTSGVILTAASNNSTSIKASAGTLCELSFLNTTTGVFDIRLYDTASAPTCSSATGVVGNYVAQSNAISPGFAIPLGPYGKAFSTGIGVCITGANANNDNTNAATGGNLNFSFK